MKNPGANAANAKRWRDAGNKVVRSEAAKKRNRAYEKAWKRRKAQERRKAKADDTVRNE